MLCSGLTLVLEECQALFNHVAVVKLFVSPDQTILK